MTASRKTPDGVLTLFQSYLRLKSLQALSTAILIRNSKILLKAPTLDKVLSKLIKWKQTFQLYVFDKDISMKLPYFYLNLYEIGVSEYHLKIIWKNHRKSIKCSHTRSEWFHIFSTDEGIASISYNPAVYVYEIFIYLS